MQVVFILNCISWHWQFMVFIKKRRIKAAPLPTTNADVVEKVEKLTEAVTDLQKTQQHNVVAIQSVVQRVELKNHLSPHAQPQIVQPPPSMQKNSFRA